jgi:hypothetical protein
MLLVIDLLSLLKVALPMSLFFILSGGLWTMKIKRVRRETKQQIVRKEIRFHQATRAILQALCSCEEKFAKSIQKKPRYFQNYRELRIKGNRYYNVLYNIAEYLITLREDFNSSIPLSELAKGYFSAVYGYYCGRFKLMPYLTQLSPSLDNITRFMAWIDHEEEQFEYSYWDWDKSIDEIRKTALSLKERHADKGMDDLEKAYQEEDQPTIREI